MKWSNILLTLMPGFIFSCQVPTENQDDLMVYKAVFHAPPERTPSSKTPDAPLAGNGDIGITMGGKPEKLTFYIGKNDFWRAYPVYPGGGIALPGGLDIAIADLENASYYTEELFGKASIKGKFIKNELKVDVNAWVASTANVVVIEMSAGFWEDYLKFEDGRYVIYMDHFNEVMPNLRNKGQWRDRLGDFNSTLSLGLVKMLFKGMIDVSSFLQKDLPQQEKWQHITDHLSRFPVGETEGRLSLKNMERGPGNKEARPVGLNRVSIHGLILPGGVCGPVTDSVFNKMLLEDVAHWQDKIKEPAEWGNTLGNGIETCFPAAVRVGFNSDKILDYLKARIARQSYPNLWIIQSGGGTETLSAVPMTVNEMLMQSYEGTIRIFPNWNHQKDASFDKLRAYGAFLVSSNLYKGEIQKVRLFSEKGRSCTIENPWPGKSVRLFRDGKKSEILSGEILTFPTVINEYIEIERLY
jgi:hypothetical protein